ncbi:hypothetical protein NST86_34085 [Bacillus sp. FSL L8-0199]|uniref:hypothetical protein n=1 Tax=Bacillus sp. FSL L8-0199 TaxID=2954616 RepID=UPI0030FA8BC8
MRKSFGEFADCIYGFIIASIVYRCTINQPKYMQQIAFIIVLIIIMGACIYAEEKKYRARQKRGKKKCKRKRIS